jgi:hypothetical protein
MALWNGRFCCRCGQLANDRLSRFGFSGYGPDLGICAVDEVLTHKELLVLHELFSIGQKGVLIESSERYL